MKIVALCLVCALAGGLVANPCTPPLPAVVPPPSTPETAPHPGGHRFGEHRGGAHHGRDLCQVCKLLRGHHGGHRQHQHLWPDGDRRGKAGSGFVITEDGYILTNYHVIDGASSIKVTFVDGTEYDATYIGGEEANDIAVIKIDATGLTPVVIGSSSDMLVGEEVTAIGNPLGELTFSQTAGIVSALNRTVTMSDGRQMNMIQTDCAINSGNSGGPLFNNHGEVIGIVSAKYSSASSSSSSTSVEGLGFAIPMDDVADMVSQLVSNGYVSGQPILGVSVNRNEISQEAQAYNCPPGQRFWWSPPACAGGGRAPSRRHRHPDQ